MTPERLATIRQEEQRQAARVLGVQRWSTSLESVTAK